MRRAAALLVVALVLAGCGGDKTAGTSPEPGVAEEGVAELTNVLELLADFVADAGLTRVIILFSPT